MGPQVNFCLYSVSKKEKVPALCGVKSSHSEREAGRRCECVCKDLISYRCVADATGSGTRWEWSPRENISLWECRFPHARCLGGKEVSKRETPRLKG